MNYGEFYWKIQLPTRKLIEIIKNHSNGLCLDAGCGKGAYLNSFKGNVVGLDINKNFVKKAKENTPKFEFVVGDISALPFRNKCLNFILCAQVCQYLKEEDLDKLLTSTGFTIKTWMYKGGIFSCLFTIIFYSFKYLFNRKPPCFLNNLVRADYKPTHITGTSSKFGRDIFIIAKK